YKTKPLVHDASLSPNHRRVLRRGRKLSPMQSVHSVTYLSGSDTGTFSPYSDGEKGDCRSLDVRLAALSIGEIIDQSTFLPVTIRGEMPGRAMGGSAYLRWNGPPHAVVPET
ncbi:hypothetical protein, partial [Mesorhizobium sp. M4B.F.Ca.ET.017.02.2.1]|uniref:hypothetical protein n=1 Tax=Mesorhizobium sp. M4B.F.Ca.ET.017.02.2.1 TaxID=2496649 RepID=UPI001AEC76AC